MAFETGTATSHTDLFNKLIAFLTTNADLITDGEVWTEDWVAPVGAANLTARVLTGVVGSGDPPKVGIQLVEVPSSSQYELQFNGMTNILAGATVLTGHANSSALVRIFADPNPMTYWFSANGRRFTVIVKISTVYSSGYFGLILPYALPTTYQYPMYVGGAAGLGSGQAADWRSLSNAHNSLALPGGEDGVPTYPPSAYVVSPQGQWERVITPYTSESNISEAAASASLHPYYSMGTTVNEGKRALSNIALGLQIEGFGSNFATHPITVYRKVPASQAYGVLDGVVACQGRNNASENIIAVGLDDYMVVQDAYRTNVERYCAVFQRPTP